jgi:hypothetical protein
VVRARGRARSGTPAAAPQTCPPSCPPQHTKPTHPDPPPPRPHPPRYAFLSSSRWVGFRLDVISTITLAAGVLLAMAIRDRISAAILALALTHVLQVRRPRPWRAAL